MYVISDSVRVEYFIKPLFCELLISSLPTNMVLVL